MSQGPGAGARLFASIGKPAVEFGRLAAELIDLFAQTFYWSIRGTRKRGQILTQMYEMGNRSLLFISVTMGFLGMITVYQVGNQVEKILPDFTMVGAGFLEIMIRESGPTLCAWMVATRVGSGIAAELGSMVVTEQVDALKMCNADPVDYLIVPRFLASSIIVLVLTVYSVIVATAMGMITGWYGYMIHPLTFLNLTLVDPSDVIIGVVKALAFGMTIPVIAAQCGLNTRGGSEGVGWATTSSVVNTCFAVVVLDFVIGAIGYLVTG